MPSRYTGRHRAHPHPRGGRHPLSQSAPAPARHAAPTRRDVAARRAATRREAARPDATRRDVTRRDVTRRADVSARASGGILKPLAISAASLGATVVLVQTALAAPFGTLAGGGPDGQGALALNVQTWTATPVSAQVAPEPTPTSASPAPTTTPSASASGVATASVAPKPKATPPTIDPARAWTPPVNSGKFTSGYGPRWGTEHKGIDLAAPIGTPIAAMSTGKVTFAGWQGGYGKKVEIKYWDGTVSHYGHMDRIDVRVGDVVAPGATVGTVGNTGYSTGPHLHLELLLPGAKEPINPEPWLSAHGVPAR